MRVIKTILHIPVEFDADAWCDYHRITTGQAVKSVQVGLEISLEQHLREANALPQEQSEQ